MKFIKLIHCPSCNVEKPLLCLSFSETIPPMLHSRTATWIRAKCLDCGCVLLKQLTKYVVDKEGSN